MLGLKTRMAAAVVLAILSGLLLAGVSYIIFPSQSSGQMPTPKPSPSWLEQLSWAMLWIGLALLISLAVVGAIMLASRIRKRMPA
jgi:uncharacterized membrane protein YphA (DoxX/SURF4 family)